jgi:glycolate oxidase iron-sulfur subunit
MSPSNLIEFSDPAFKTLINQCIHCGLCLPACPTYAVNGAEMDAPRGRIALMRAAAQGRVGVEDLRDGFAKHMDLCLACLACQTACPSGVNYGTLIETTKLAIEHHRPPGGVERFVRWLGFRQVMPHVGRMKFMARLMWVYQVVGLQRLVRALDILPQPLKAMEAVLPPITPRYRDYRQPAPALGVKRGAVAFFIGCIQEAFISQANEATIRVLQRNGYEVHFPLGQTCCGAAPLHVGETALAQELARKNIEAFEPYALVINNAGGCGATLKDEYAPLFAGDPLWAEKARQLGAKVKDLSEFLADHLHVPPTGTVRAKVTYADSCHLRHAQKVVAQPRQLIQNIPGVQYVELKLPERCCGSAGVYNLVHPDSADAILDDKMADIAATGAELIVASNTGCHMQLWAGVRRAKLRARVVHVAELLELSYQAMDNSRAP